MDDNPAQPLLDMRSKLGEWSRNILDRYDKPTGKKSDTSWHDSMVKEANEGFRKNSERKKLTAEGPKLGGKKSTKKKTAKKPIVRKR